MKHLGTQTIETKRLILRKFELKDTQYMYDSLLKTYFITCLYFSFILHIKKEIIIKKTFTSGVLS